MQKRRNEQSIEETQNGPKSLTLSADKGVFKSNGKEEITFTVKADDEVLTEGYVIKLKGEADSTLLGNVFSTKTAGAYSFYATYAGIESEAITITASEIVFIITADTMQLKANGLSKVELTAKLDGEDITSKTSFFYTDGDEEKKLSGNIFTTEEEGEYIIYCKFEEYSSQRITVTAIPVFLRLQSAVTEIKANGKDSVYFRVYADETEVTTESSIYHKESDLKLASNTFATTEEGSYEFYAKYRNSTATAIKIEALASSLVISVEKAEVHPGENVNLTGLLDGTYNVSDEALFFAVNNESVTKLENHVFNASGYGVYTVYAEMNGKRSNELSIISKPSAVTLTVDKSEIIFTGKEEARFTVKADGEEKSDAKIYYKSEVGEIALESKTFSSGTSGEFRFYAEYAGLRSPETMITVKTTKFFKQSIAFQTVATWCGYSPEMMYAFDEVKQKYSTFINIMSMHLPSSQLYSSDFDTRPYIYEKTGNNSPPYGDIDFTTSGQIQRKADAIYTSYWGKSGTYPATSGIAIESRREGETLKLKLRVKAESTGEYNVMAIVVEDDAVMRQRLYPDFIHMIGDYVEDFVHQSVATFGLPGVDYRTGQSIGEIETGQEKTAEFSIMLNKDVGRNVNLDNCRVIAYVLKPLGTSYTVNNSATCPLDGSVDYKYDFEYVTPRPAF